MIHRLLQVFADTVAINRKTERRRSLRQRPNSRFAEILEIRDLLAVDAMLVKDINTVPSIAHSNPRNFTSTGSLTFFTAANLETGDELWSTDGTPGGTRLVKDIRPGTQSSSSSRLVNVSGTLYFAANDGANGLELWKSLGTPETTTLVKNIRPGAASATPSQLTNVNGSLYFTANDGSSGYTLWKTDGSPTGTVIVKDFPTNPMVQDLTVFNGSLYFTTASGLWKTDGTASGTEEVAHLGIGVQQLTKSGDSLFFVNNGDAMGKELWKIDGTGNVDQVSDIASGYLSSNPGNLTDVNGTLYFRATDGNNGYELWKSDGTESGTLLVKDFFPGANNSGYPTNLVNVNGTLFFTANNGTNGNELWTTDGTEAGTRMLTDLNTTVDEGAKSLTNVDGTLFFVAAPDGQKVLFKLDGSTPLRIKEYQSNLPVSLSNINGKLFFAADDGSVGQEPWLSDGTAAGTQLLRDVRFGSLGSTPSKLTTVGGTLFFSADDGSEAGRELWKTDGTETGTAKVREINSVGNANPDRMTNVSGTLFFIADDGINGFELWKSDGTTAGTQLVKDIRTGTLGSNPKYLTNINGTLFFSATDPTNGEELWKSDGTATGTVLVKDIRAGSSSSTISYLTNVNGALFFRATNGVTGLELWQSDGTVTGTNIVRDIRPGTLGSGARALVNVNGTLFFRANDGTSGYELWKSDGSPGGTSLVKDIRSGGAGSNPLLLTNSNGTLFFQAHDGISGYELWKSDGSSSGTVLVRDINVGSNHSFARQLTNVGGTLFFEANNPASGGYALWKSDGTAAGTSLILDVNTTSAAQSVSNMTNLNGTLYFRGLNPNGALWLSDGTTAGTRPLRTLVNNYLVDSMDLNPPAVVNDTLYYSVKYDLGSELHKLNENRHVGITINPNVIMENAGSNAFVGSLTTTDVNAGDSFSYTLAAGINDTDNAAFTIDGAALRAISGFDYETRNTYAIRLRSTDQQGLWIERTFNVTVSDINEAPHNITLSTSSVPENQPAGVTVALISSADQDAGNTFSYQLVAGAGDTDNSFFTIEGNTLKTTGSFDYEEMNTRSIRVRTTDQGGLSFEKTLIVNIVNVTELGGIDVQLGLTQRSYVRYLDILFDRPDDLLDMINNQRFQLIRSDLNGINPVNIPLSNSMFTAVGNSARIDFGIQGIGGNRNSNVGDGYYELAVDMDGDGAFESKRYFYRLLGDVNGDRKVDSLDTGLVLGALGSTNSERDGNGDGIVSAIDRTLVQRAIGRKLKDGLFTHD